MTDAEHPALGTTARWAKHIRCSTAFFKGNKRRQGAFWASVAAAAAAAAFTVVGSALADGAAGDPIAEPISSPSPGVAEPTRTPGAVPPTAETDTSSPSPENAPSDQASPGRPTPSHGLEPSTPAETPTSTFSPPVEQRSITEVVTSTQPPSVFVRGHRYSAHVDVSLYVNDDWCLDTQTDQRGHFDERITDCVAAGQEEIVNVKVKQDGRILDSVTRNVGPLLDLILSAVTDLLHHAE